MKVIDPGHIYQIDALEGGEPQVIYFVKRQGENYPGNTNSQHGPITQEFLRAILDRCKYMNNQGPCIETEVIISSLRQALLMFEVRAARCREVTINLAGMDIEQEETCPTCGHIQCDQERHNKEHWSKENPISSHLKDK